MNRRAVTICIARLRYDLVCDDCGIGVITVVWAGVPDCLDSRYRANSTWIYFRVVYWQPSSAPNEVLLYQNAFRWSRRE